MIRNDILMPVFLSAALLGGCESQTPEECSMTEGEYRNSIATYTTQDLIYIKPPFVIYGEPVEKKRTSREIADMVAKRNLLCAKYK